MSVSSARGRNPVGGAQLDHGVRQLAGLRLGVQERPGADLHVEHQRAGALGELLAHDRAGDQRQRLGRGGDIAQRVDLAVGGRQLARREDRRADVAELLADPALEMSAVNPAMASSLSSVPPVWPRPRPAACGTAPPQAMTTGTSGMVILSPTPPVECLSHGRATRPRSPSARRRPPSPPSSGRSRRGHAAQENRHQQCRHLLVGDPAVGVGVDDPVDRRVGQPAAVALGPDHRGRVESEAAHGFRARSSGPKASGSRSPSGRGPPGWSISSSGPPCSSST